MFARKMHCLECEHEGNPKIFTPGSFGLEIFLWLLLLIPGLIYSIWRLSARYGGCEICGSKRIITMEKWEKLKMEKEV